MVVDVAGTAADATGAPDVCALSRWSGLTLWRIIRCLPLQMGQSCCMVHLLGVWHRAHRRQRLSDVNQTSFWALVISAMTEQLLRT